MTYLKDGLADKHGREVTTLRRLQCGILVVGAGTGGIMAALAAGDCGAEVIVLERGEGLGGVGTMGGIHDYYKGVHAGTQLRVNKRANAAAYPDSIYRMRKRGYHPEAKKRAIYEEMLSRPNITLVLSAIVAAVETANGKVTAVIAETEEGTLRIEAAVTIDCTGNGDIAALAGAAFEEGRDWDGSYQPFSLPPRVLEAEGKLAFRNFDAGWVDPSSARDISRAYRDGREQLWRSPFRQEELLTISPQLGIREGRHIRGMYVLDVEDLIMDRTFPDTVMRCFTHYDNHARDMANESSFAERWVTIMNLWHVEYGCDVPYRSFVPERLDGLLIGCRALSMTRDAAAGLRMQPDIQSAGEVAGTAAALCVELGVEPRDLDAELLQSRLVRRGVLKAGDIGRIGRPWITLLGAKRKDGVWTEEGAARESALLRLAEALGTDEEGESLWWLYKAGEAAVPPLLEAFAAATGKRRRGIALALALLGRSEGAGELADAVERGDADVLSPPYDRHPARWVACLKALALLRHPGACDATLRRFGELDSFHALQVLHYWKDAAAAMTKRERDEVGRTLRAWLSRPGLGEDWENIPLRWNLEMNAGYVLALLGDPEGFKMLEAYEQSASLHERRAARRFLERLRREMHILPPESGSPGRPDFGSLEGGLP